MQKRHIFSSAIMTAAMAMTLATAGCHGRASRHTADADSVQAPLAVNFYLERSGSMIPYDSPKGRGEFKDAIMSLLNVLPQDNDSTGCDGVRLFVVNDGVYEYPKTFREFITDKNIFETTRGIGDASFTDFGKILDSLFCHAQDNDISILASDMIYSTQDVGVVNTEKIFSEAKAMTQTIMKESGKGKSVVLVKLNASFVGTYYPYNRPSGVNYNGTRPYYLMIVGSDASMNRLMTESKYQKFIQFTELNGYEQMMLFCGNNCYSPYYSLVQNDRDTKGRMRTDRKHNEGEGIHAVTDVETDRNTGELQMVVALNMGNMFIEESYLSNPANYSIKADDKVDIVSIAPIQHSDITQNNRDVMDKATHRMVLNMEKFTHDQEITISLRNQFQQWIIESSSDDDSHPDAGNPQFASTTFSLRYLMQGIYDSYANQKKDELNYFTIKLSINK